MNPLDWLCRARLYRQNLKERRRKLHRIAFSWCGDKVLADDLTQEALTKAYKNLKQLRELYALERWIIDILTNCWRDHLRRQKKHDDFDTLDEFEEFKPEDGQEKAETVRRVRAAVARLPLKQREVLTLVDLAGYTYPQVAETLEIPLGTVTSRLARARDALRRQLKDYCLHAESTQPIPLHRVK
jgi:RNA polymerase sigma-70 factor (ECF subfamily)